MGKARMQWIRLAVAFVLCCGAGFEHNVYATITEGSASGTDSLAIGNASAASKNYATALGANTTAGATASGASSIAIGDSSAAEGTSAVALGNNAKGLKSFSVAIGYNSNAKTSEYTTAVGAMSVSSGSNAASFAANEKIKKDNERMQKQIATILSKMETEKTI